MPSFEKQVKNMSNKVKTLLIFPSVTIDIDGRPYTYYMTNNLFIMNHKLERLGCRHVRPSDFQPNPVLADVVKDKMVELWVTFSLTLSNGANILNYYRPGKTPVFVRLTEILDPWRKVAGDGETISVMQKMQNLISSTQENVVQTSWSPLMSAVAKEDLDWAMFLLKAGTTPNDISPKGFSPLMIAVLKNNKKLVELLLKHGADVDAMNASGWTAYRLSVFVPFVDGKSRAEIAAILEKAGARGDFKGLPCSSYLKRMSFHDTLKEYIDRFTEVGHRKESLIYKQCNMDKRTFSKIKNNKKPNYHPRKEKVFSLIIGMHHSLAEAEDLLASAGYAFSTDNEFDQIIKQHIKDEDYSMKKIDAELFEKTGRTLSFYEKEKKE